jgi:hypothetical protein
MVWNRYISRNENLPTCLRILVSTIEYFRQVCFEKFRNFIWDISLNRDSCVENLEIPELRNLWIRELWILRFGEMLDFWIQDCGNVRSWDFGNVWSYDTWRTAIRRIEHREIMNSRDIATCSKLLQFLNRTFSSQHIFDIPNSKNHKQFKFSITGTCFFEVSAVHLSRI